MSACKWVLDLLSLCLPFLTSWLQPLISKWKGTFDLHITASCLRCVLKELMCVILVQVHGFFQVSVSLHVISVLKNSLFLVWIKWMGYCFVRWSCIIIQVGSSPAWSRSVYPIFMHQPQKTLLMHRLSQNMQVAKCLKFSGCGVHLEIMLQ